MEVITSLYEGHYHLGIAALINSVSVAGFKGSIIIGYKGKELPYWVGQFKAKDAFSFFLNDDITLSFRQIDTEWHFGYYKPIFLAELCATPETTKVYYFDPDIVVNCPWQFYSDWVENGVALCLDNCFPLVPPNHPWRAEWRKLANNTSITSNLEQYINSGFIGLKKEHLPILKKWIDLTGKYQQLGGDLKKFEKDGFRAYKGDQDLLNAAMTVSPEVNYSIIGKEGMGFSQPAYLMLHAVDSSKPWKKKFISSALKGIPPTLAERAYWQYSKGLIKIYEDSFLSKKNKSLKIASFIGRSYKRN